MGVLGGLHAPRAAAPVAGAGHARALRSCAVGCARTSPAILHSTRIAVPRACSSARWRRTDGRLPKLAPAAFSELAAPAAAPSFMEALNYSDALVWGVCAAGALVWVKVFDLLVAQGLLEQKLSRKLVHITSGPLLVLLWPLFSADAAARYIAASIPLLNALRLLLVGSGAVSDPGLVASVSRLGDRSELLKGPFYYCVVLILASVLFWRVAPAGVVAVSMMCGGDGLADVVGRRFGSVKLPYNSSKSWAGSLAMFGGGLAMSMLFLTLFCSLGFFSCSSGAHLPAVAAVCLACTVVESLPVNKWLDDNLSVPAVAAVLGVMLLH